MKKVLVVDDEPDFCYFMKKNLEASGDFCVNVCSQSTHALELAKRLQPDLVLLDVMMPGIPGDEIAMRLKKMSQTAATPIVFLTAVASPEETHENENRIGGEYVVAKPVQMGELLGVIHTVMK